MPVVVIIVVFIPVIKKTVVYILNFIVSFSLQLLDKVNFRCCINAEVHHFSHLLVIRCVDIIDLPVSFILCIRIRFNITMSKTNIHHRPVK